MSTGILSTRSRSEGGLVVIGGGVAGLRVVQSARQEGYEGPVHLIGAEPSLPYDRPPLTKQVLSGELASSATCYHPESYYRDLDVQVQTETRVLSIDASRPFLTLEDRTRIPFTAAVVATGSRPRRLPFTTPRNGVHLLRTADDARRLRDDLIPGRRLTIVGAGLIGAEVASTAAAAGLEVTIVETAPTPLERSVGVKVGQHLATLHLRAGVHLVCGKAVTGFAGADDVEGVRLDDGSIIGTDVVLVGVGVVPDTEWLAGSGLELTDGLTCDEYLATRRPGVFGAGDAVSWFDVSTGSAARSQQWTTASEQGRYVGRMLVRGPAEVGPFGSDGYFWSDQYGVRIQGAGRPTNDVSFFIRQPEPFRLVAAYQKNGRISGALAVNSPRQFRILRRSVQASAPWPEVEMQLAGKSSRGGDAA